MRDEVLRLQVALGLIPLVNPIDHAQQGEGSGARADGAFCMTSALSAGLHVGDQALDEVYVFLLSSIDTFAQRGRERMVLVQHDSDFAVARAENDFNVQPDQRAQALLGSHDAAHGTDDQFLGDLHGMVHDLEQDFVLALEMMVEATLAEFEGGGDVVHGSGVVSALLKQASGGAQDFLPGINRSFAWHRVPW